MPSFGPAISIFQSVGLASVDQVTFTGTGSNFWIANRGSVDLWFRLDGTNPAASADGSHLLVAGQDRSLPDPTGNREIRLTAGAATCLYAVELL